MSHVRGHGGAYQPTEAMALSDDAIIARALAAMTKQAAGEAVADAPDDDGLKPAVVDAPGKGLGALAVQKLGITWDGVGGMPYRCQHEYKAALDTLTEAERTAHWEARHNDPDDISYQWKPTGDEGALIFLGKDGKPLDPQPTPEERAQERRLILEKRARGDALARETVVKYMAEAKAAAEEEAAKADDSATGADA